MIKRLNFQSTACVQVANDSDSSVHRVSCLDDLNKVISAAIQCKQHFYTKRQQIELHCFVS